jgi:hypothetical protein
MGKEPPKPKKKGHADFYSSASPFAREARPYDARVEDSPGAGSVIDTILATGNAVIFGTTRDGGAICVTVCEDDQRHKTYVHSQIELDNAMSFLAHHYSQD